MLITQTNVTMSIKKYWPECLIVILAALFYLPFLGSVHLFDWDEINFAESAREMLATGNYLTVQINFEPFWEKPPLFIWMQVLSMKLFGINEFAARFPNAICGIVTLLFLFTAGRKLVNKKFGSWWVLAFGGSLLPFVYFKSGIIDPWFNLFIFMGIYFIYQYLSFNENKLRNLILSAVTIGLSVLTKGPVGFLIFGLALFVFVLYKRFRFYFRWIDIIIFLLIFALVGGFWFLLQIMNGNFSIMHDFIIYQIRLFQTKDAGHGGFLLYHFVVVFFGVFPVSVLALKSFSRKQKMDQNADFMLMMKILLWVVLILFTIVKTKIVHYSSMAYFPLTFLGAWVIYQLSEKQIHFSRWMYFPVGFMALLYSLIISALPLIDRFKDKIIASGIIKDQFAVGNLQAQVHWSGWEWLIGLVLMVGVGFAFYLFINKKSLQGLVTLFAGTVLFVFVTMAYMVPRIEKYSQNAAIVFFKEISTQDCYFTTIGYKSYAPYFYGAKQKPKRIESNDNAWLLSGDIDKPVYFILKNTREERFFSEHPDIQKLYSKNGFVMAKRTVNESANPNK